MREKQPVGFGPGLFSFWLVLVCFARGYAGLRWLRCVGLCWRVVALPCGALRCVAVSRAAMRTLCCIAVRALLLSVILSDKISGTMPDNEALCRDVGYDGTLSSKTVAAYRWRGAAAGVFRRMASKEWICSPMMIGIPFAWRITRSTLRPCQVPATRPKPLPWRRVPSALAARPVHPAHPMRPVLRDRVAAVAAGMAGVATRPALAIC